MNNSHPPMRQIISIASGKSAEEVFYFRRDAFHMMREIRNSMAKREKNT
jgi:hypothetical protein